METIPGPVYKVGNKYFTDKSLASQYETEVKLSLFIESAIGSPSLSMKAAEAVLSKYTLEPIPTLEEAL